MTHAEIIVGNLGWRNPENPTNPTQFQAYGPKGRWEGKGGDSIEKALVDLGISEGARLIIVAVKRGDDVEHVETKVRQALRQPTCTELTCPHHGEDNRRRLDERLQATRRVLAERERELLELKGPCPGGDVNAGPCDLHRAHAGPCRIPVRGGTMKPSSGGRS